MEAASHGSDPPLNMPLPHTRVMMGTNKGTLLPHAGMQACSANLFASPVFLTMVQVQPGMDSILSDMLQLLADD